jgi:hypothetical protein
VDGPPTDLLASGRDVPRRPLPRWAKAVAAVGVGAAGVAGLLVQRDASAPVLREEVFAAELAVVPEDVAVTQSGVIVLPVALTSPGLALTVRSAEITAAPVRSAPVVTAPEVVPPGLSRRLVTIVQPDCAVIGPGVGGELVATVAVRVTTPSGREEELRLSFGSAPVMRARLAGLCGGAAQAAADAAEAAEAAEAADAAADAAADEASEVGLEVRMLELGRD